MLVFGIIGTGERFGNESGVRSADGADLCRLVLRVGLENTIFGEEVPVNFVEDSETA